MDAITQVESKGNAKAKTVRTQEYCKFSHHVVAECNNILKAKGSKKRYTMADRFSPEKSSRDVCSVPSQNTTRQTIRSEHSHVAWRNKLQQEQNATVLQQGEEVFEKLNKPQNASSKVPM